jgi:hypothetical protein
MGAASGAEPDRTGSIDYDEREDSDGSGVHIHVSPVNMTPQ